MLMQSQIINVALMKMSYHGSFTISAYVDTNGIPLSHPLFLSSTGIGLNHVPDGIVTNLLLYLFHLLHEKYLCKLYKSVESSLLSLSFNVLILRFFQTFVENDFLESLPETVYLPCKGVKV